MKVLKSNFVLVILSILVSLFFLEIYFSLTISKPYKHEYFFKRYYLYNEGNIFKNVNNFFKFSPNSSIRQDAYYFVDDDFVKEFSYIINTNNFGLVQSNDIQQNIPSILFLGDSLTEGLGAPSWTDKFGKDINGYQIINGGIRGTSAEQSELLEKHIAEFFEINKIIFIYQGGFISRDLYQFSNDQLKCLADYTYCAGNQFDFGFPLNEKNPKKFLIKMKMDRDKIRTNEKNNVTWKKIRRRIKSEISQLYVISIPTTFIRNNFYKSKNDKIMKNFHAINRLIQKYKDNIVFIRLNSFTEIMQGKDYYSIYTDDYIKSLTNKHFYCDLENNLDNFYVHDLHPNELGYDKLYRCVKKIINDNLL